MENPSRPGDTRPGSEPIKSEATENAVEASASPPASEEEAPPTLKEWWIQNGPVLAIVLALLGFLFVRFDAEGLLAILKAAIGLSFVIFLHELGHFLVAKWCDVHVTAFSIGFGPVIPGCWFKWGETTYKLALFPLGGYVQMVGQVDGDESSDGSEDDPRSFRNKSVGARMAIISAGVVMNVILAIVCFVVVFQGPGKERDAAIISAVDTRSPAFEQGIRWGDELVAIDQHENPYFETLKARVLASSENEKIDLYVRHLGSTDIVHYRIAPRKDSEDLMPFIGISSASQPELVARRFLEGNFSRPVLPHSPAARAEPPLEFGDRIIATSDPDHPAKLKELPEDPRLPGTGQRDYFEYSRRMALLADKEITLQIERGNKKLEVKVPPAYHGTLGVRMTIGLIAAVRDRNPDGTEMARTDGVRKGDLIRAVDVLTGDGKLVRFAGPGNVDEEISKIAKEKPDSKDERKFVRQPLDPERLPRQLRDWADSVQAKPGAEKKITVFVERRRNQGGQEKELIPLALTWDDRWRFDKDLPMGPSSPLAIPELGFAYQVRTIVDAVTHPAAAGDLRQGDVIKRVRLTYFDGSGKETNGPWTTLEEHQWAWVSRTALGSPAALKSLTLEVARSEDGKNTETNEIEITPTEDKSWPIAERGLILMKDTRIQKASNPIQAVVMGLEETRTNMMQVYQHIRGIATGRLSAKNLGGPGTIAVVAYKFARMDFWQFVFFLGLISVNLAVINFLPIPILDGGHMVFLIYEAIRGKPASEGIRVGATYAGLAIVLCLMVFVIYLDISRWVL